MDKVCKDLLKGSDLLSNLFSICLEVELLHYGIFVFSFIFWLFLSFFELTIWLFSLTSV